MITSIDPKTGVPLYQQIADALRDSIAAGRILPGQQLATVREMAARMRVNPATVVAAYDILSREHLIVTKHGAGTFVSVTAARSQKLRRGSRDKLEKLLKIVVAVADAAGVTDAELHRLLTNTRRQENQTHLVRPDARREN